MQNLMSQNAGSMPAKGPIPAVPLRKNTLPFGSLKTGGMIIFSESCTLPQLRARKCHVRNTKTYRFGTQQVRVYQLAVEGSEIFSLSIAEDADGHYLAISRQLSEQEQDQWFGRDALGFFTEPSTAKTIRCKADRIIESAWAAERYIKTVDWTPGSLISDRMETPFHYNLLINETGEKALEIEQFDEMTLTNVYVTVYRPIEDILTIAEAIPHIPAPVTAKPAPTPIPVIEELAVRQRPDFRRASDETLHVPALTLDDMLPETDTPPLPSFLASRPVNGAYLSLDEIIAPENEPERVRCSTLAAKALIDVSLQRGIRVRDVLRDLIGLESALSDEVIFELPLSEKDYRELAQRYRLRPDAKSDIRAKLQEELRKKLLS